VFTSSLVKSNTKLSVLIGWILPSELFHQWMLNTEYLVLVKSVEMTTVNFILGVDRLTISLIQCLSAHCIHQLLSFFNSLCALLGLSWGTFITLFPLRFHLVPYVLIDYYEGTLCKYIYCLFVSFKLGVCLILSERKLIYIFLKNNINQFKFK